jgi:acetyl-CoA acyltransferase 2
MSQVPHIIRGLRGGLKLGQGKLEDWLWEGLNDPYAGCSMAITAENCAVKYGITREDADAYALRSQQLAHKAWTSGAMKDEVAPVEIKSKKGVTLVEKDDHMRPETTMEVLAKLPTVFKKDGVVTAGNASGIVDGAAALVIAGESAVKDKGLKPLGRIVSWATVGVDPTLMGMGPAPAIRKALERAGLKLADLDLIEINEAFAPQYLACEKELGLDRDKVNVNGGAIALGHPLGASGARLLLTLLLELRRRGKKYGVASACIGGGQGIAMIIEAV